MLNYTKIFLHNMSVENLGLNILLSLYLSKNNVTNKINFIIFFITIEMSLKKREQVFKSSLINRQFLYESCHYFRKTKKKEKKIESRNTNEKNRTNPRNPRNKIVKYATALTIFYYFLKKNNPKVPSSLHF